MKTELITTGASAPQTILPEEQKDAARLLIFGALQWAVQWHRPDGALTLGELTDQAMLLFTREK